MARNQIEFGANANFGPALAEIAALNKALHAAATQFTVLNQPQRIKESQRLFLNAAESIKGIEVAAMRTRTEAAKMTDTISRGKLGIKGFRQFKEQSDQIIEQQLRIRRGVAMATGRDALGNITGNLILPTKSYAGAAELAAMKTNVWNQAMRSIAMSTVNMGKNMQWAGRQLTVGLTLPIVAAGVVTGKAAYDIDAEMVRLQKVYGDTADVSEEELGRVRDATMKTARDVAKEYGVMAKDTIKLGAELAATGLTGNELQSAIKETSRIMMLGEIAQQQAIDATIALKTVFQLDPTELAEKFNFLNAVENQTSTSLQDLTEAIPRAAGVIENMGGSVEDMGIFMVAMKERGIDAAEGANALKSAMNRLINPTKQAKDQLMGFGIDVEDIVARNAGDLMGTLRELGGELQNLDQLSRQQAIGRLFGTWQFNRISGLIEGLVSGTGQVGQAMRLASADASQLAEIAEAEEQRMAESASGRIKRTLAAIQIELAELGKSFLPVVQFVLSVVEKIISIFQGLPGPIKAVAKLMLGFTAIVGPMVMLTGLMFNFFGSIAMGVLKFQQLTKGLAGVITGEEQFSSVLSKATPQVYQQTAALEDLNNAMRENRDLMRAAVMEEMKIRRTVDSTGAVRYRSTEAGKKGQYITPNENIKAMWGEEDARANSTTVVGNMNGVADASERTANAADKEAKSRKVSHNAILGSVGMIGLMVAGGNGWVQALSAGALVLSAMAPLLVAIKGSAVAAKVATQARVVWEKISNALSVKRLITEGALLKTMKAQAVVGAATGAKFGASAMAAGSILGFLKPIGGILLRFMGPIGLIITGLTTIAFLWGKIKGDSDEARKNQQAMAGGISALAGAVGAEYAPANESVIDYGKNITGVAGKAKEFAEANKEFVESLKNLAESEGGDEALVDRMALMAAQMAQAGIEADKIREAIAIALESVNRGHLAVTVEARIKFGDQTSAFAEITTQMIDTVTKTMRQGGISDEAVAQSEEFAKIFAGSLGPDLQKNHQAFTVLRQILNDRLGEVWGDLEIEDHTKKYFAKAGVDPTNREAVVGWLSRFKDETEMMNALNLDSTVPGNLAVAESFQHIYRTLSPAIEEQRRWVGAVASAKHMSIEGKDAVNGLAGMQERLRSNLIPVRQAEKEWKDALSQTNRELHGLNPAQELAIQNHYRMKAGLPALTQATREFANEVEMTSLSVQELTQSEMELVSNRAQAMTGAMRSNVESNFQGLIDIVMDEYDAQTEAGSKSYEKLNKDADKSFDGQQKAAEDSFDAQRDALEDSHKAQSKAMRKRQKDEEEALKDRHDEEIKTAKAAGDARIDAIKAEQDAANALDELRQRLFDRERTRLQRMAEMANTNIDFNIAMNTGDIDEAARLMAQAEATSMEWAHEDSALLADDEAKRRNAGFEERIKSVEEANQAAIESIEARQEVEREAQQEAMELERERFEAAHELRRRDLEDAKAKSQERLKAERDSAQAATNSRKDEYLKDRAANRERLDASMQAEKTASLSNTNEWKIQAGRVYDIAKALGIDITHRNAEWNEKVRTGWVDAVDKAQKQTAADENWKEWGESITAAATQGALGTSLANLVHYIKTGELPTTTIRDITPVQADRQAAARKAETATAAAPTTDPARRDQEYHTGGVVGTGGTPRKAKSLRPDELPAILQKGEFVVNRDTVNRFGEDYFHNLQGAKNSMDKEGRMHLGGIAEPAAIGVAGALGAMIRRHVEMAAARKDMEMLAMGARPEQTMFGSLNKARPDVSALPAPPMPVGGGQFERTGRWPARVWARLASNTAAAREFIASMWPATRGGSPDVNRGNVDSDHSWGKALDIFPGGTPLGRYANGPALQEGWNVANWLVQNPEKFGTKYVIWQKKINSGGGWRDYTRYGQNPGPTLGHYDHVHASFLHKGGLVGGKNPQVTIPGLRTGGRIKMDNTLANLHRGETVLTSRITDKLERGVDRLDSGANVQYNININGAGISDPDALAGIVVKKIQRMEQVKGIGRTIR